MSPQDITTAFARSEQMAPIAPVAQPSVVALSDRASIPLGADHPDAAPHRLDGIMRVAGHALVLAGIVAFLAYYSLWMPLWGETAAAYRSAHVLSISPALIEIRAPMVNGIFLADSALPAGAAVRKDQVLGRVDSPDLSARIDERALELRLLRERQTELQRRTTQGTADWLVNRETHEVAMQIAVTSQSVARLENVRRQLAIRAPADGILQQDLPLSAIVQPGQSLGSLYPNGGAIQFEVSAPVELANDLARRSRVDIEFATAQGKVVVDVRPITAPVRQFVKTAGRSDEVWGAFRCVADSVPDTIRMPGLIGKLH